MQQKGKKRRFWIYLSCFQLFRSILSEVYEYFVTAHFRGIAGDPHGGVLRDLARGDIVLPAMPWAGHDRVVELSLAEWPSTMHAYVADRIELTGDVGERHGFACDLKLVDRTRWHLDNLGGAYKRHGHSLA